MGDGGESWRQSVWVCVFVVEQNCGGGITERRPKKMKEERLINCGRKRGGKRKGGRD